MRSTYLAAAVIAAVAIGCSVEDPDESSEEELTASSEAAIHFSLAGKRLFEREAFQGNGRTCRTCHEQGTGTISPESVQERFDDDPDDPLFRSIDSDDGVGDAYTRLLTDATILVHIPLPAGWALAADPTATHATFARAVSTTNNVPALDTIFMADGRNTSLEEQALGAVNSHYEPGRQPTSQELAKIADFQQSIGFFSNLRLLGWANGILPPPALPQGITASQKRGRKWFVPSVGGICGHCHAGPMLNETSEFLLAPLPPGSRFFSAFVSELNKAGNEVQDFVVTSPDGTTQTLSTPDPGRALITGNPADINAFRIPTVWGINETAPYFHDNSAATLEDVMQHYSDYFQIIGLPAITPQEQKDIVNYMKLL